MREILFRGKQKDNGEWVEGHLLWCEEGKVFITPRHTPIGGLTICDIGVICCTHIVYEVIPETVVQYTGLTDKNGKKVFEGDIVKFSYDENDETPTFYSIEWKSDCACFGYAETADKMLEVDALHCEVIGNIHDNPELLKGGVVDENA